MLCTFIEISDIAHLNVIGKHVVIHQLADDMSTFMRHLTQVPKIIQVINRVSNDSGLKLLEQLEGMPKHQRDLTEHWNSSIKSVVKCLGIHMSCLYFCCCCCCCVFPALFWYLCFRCVSRFASVQEVNTFHLCLNRAHVAFCGRLSLLLPFASTGFVVCLVYDCVLLSDWFSLPAPCLFLSACPPMHDLLPLPGINSCFTRLWYHHSSFL